MKFRTQRAGTASSGQTHIVVTSKREDPFARIPHTLLEDDSLSWKAKGILCYLVGKPSGWKVRVQDICRRGTDGVTAVRAALNELRLRGYTELVRVHSEEGKISEWIWKVSDSPIFQPDSGNPHLEKPEVENRHHSKNNRTKNHVSKNESEETKETKETPEVSGACDVFEDHPAEWKPSPIRSLSKHAQLRKLTVPRDYPSEDEFETFLSDSELSEIACKRPDLYEDLCDNKWHHWSGQRWNRIRDWKAYVIALEEKINGFRQ